MGLNPHSNVETFSLSGVLLVSKKDKKDNIKDIKKLKINKIISILYI